MLIPSYSLTSYPITSSLSRRVNANSQPIELLMGIDLKLIKKGEC